MNPHFSYERVIFWLFFSLLGMMSCSDDETSLPEIKEEHLPRGDQPHLRFEICSDDGFSIEADSIEGNVNVWKLSISVSWCGLNLISFWKESLLAWRTRAFILPKLSYRNMPSNQEQTKRKNKLDLKSKVHFALHLLYFIDHTWTVAWRAVIDGVQEARAAASLRQLVFAGMSGAHMMGLLHDAVVYLVEQLQGAKSCYRHTFRFHRQPSQEEDLPINPSGCARSEVYLRSAWLFRAPDFFLYWFPTYYLHI